MKLTNTELKQQELWEFMVSEAMMGRSSTWNMAFEIHLLQKEDIRPKSVVREE
jgi:hypothetical protein